MNKSIQVPRETVSEFAPTIEKITIDKDKIGAVIGQGGKVIRGIEEEFECTVNIEDEGIIHISGLKDNATKAKEFILVLVTDPEVGNEYEGEVVRITDFGAFVNILPGKDGLVHISALDNERVEKVTDVVNEGDMLQVKIIEVDKMGRINLTRMIDGTPVESSREKKSNSGFKNNKDGNKFRQKRSKNFRKNNHKENSNNDSEEGEERSW